MSPRPPDADARRRIVDSTIEAIRTRGADGATARAIAEFGGFNQALIYYYFDDLKGALIAARDATSDRRMARYLPELERIGTLEELSTVGTELFQEDVKAGTITVISELVSACLTHPDLKPHVVRSMEPWVDLAERLIERVVRGSLLENVLPTRDIAWALLAFYMGIEQLYNLDDDSSRAERLFEMFGRLAPLADPLLKGQEAGR
jgi:AcrR family transcriptional regulator